MDAAHWGQVLILSISISSLAACQKSQIQDAGSCTTQSVPNSFLVKWNGNVPQEFQNYKVGPNSSVTHFVGNQSDIETQVLAKYPNDYLIAEHDFKIKNIVADEAVAANSSAPTGTAAWGPSDIQAQAAWSYSGKQGDGVIVAVIDSGVDANHPLLAGKISSKAYNFIDNNTDISDGVGHGTHVSGIIAGGAGANNFTGIAPNATIMPLKFIDANGEGDVSKAITAISYAQANGAKVINASWGGSDCSTVLQQEIALTAQSGTVFVNAAGNDSHNISVAPEYPAVYQAPGKITVASSNSNEALSLFSNFGTLVDLAAPGEVILSTIPPTSGQSEGQMTYMSGTSMAAPFVSGVAALLYSVKPTATPQEIVAAINSSVTYRSLNVHTQGRLNALAAIQYLQTH
jgi:subtilisin family serine protease